MKRYYKYLCVLLFFCFTIFYFYKIKNYISYNNSIRDYLEYYSSINNSYCIPGKYSDFGVILGHSGNVIDIDGSYSNMKGSGFNLGLIEYKSDECKINRKSSINKYIYSGNDSVNNISIVIDIINGRSYEKFNDISEDKNIVLNYLINDSFLIKYNDSFDRHDTLLFKGSSTYELNNFINNLHDEFLCVNYNYDVLDMCSSYELNSINMVHYIERDLILNTKKILNKGIIIFIKESEVNLNELSSLINYILSRGYNIVSINDLLL